MLKKNWGQIVFVLPPHVLTPSTEYAQMSAFAVAGAVKGLALLFAPKGIVVNGIVLGDRKDYETIADWIVFLASNNARNIVGELILCD
jgi:NAD(P)-dependent dehydrogenase (short-subunit alcohol dehydrogenase family)